MQEWIPYGVILGLRTSEADKTTIMQFAKDAGVKHIFQSFIDNNGGLDAVEIFQTTT